MRKEAVRRPLNAPSVSIEEIRAIEVFERCVAKVQGEISGDAYWYRSVDHRVWSFIADGLGHGAEAAVPSTAAVETIREAVERLPPTFDLDACLRDMLVRVDRALRGTRGAAVGLAVLDATRGEGHFAGVGNIALRVISDEGVTHPISMHGIAGVNMRTVRVQHFRYKAGSLVVMHSDGLSARFDLERRQALRSPLETLGEALMSGHAANDDVTLLLLRERG